MSTTADELREEVRRRYAESARAVTEGTGSCGCGSGSCCEGGDDGAKFGEALYDAEQRGELPETATLASLGCGNPTAVAELREGETVLDLGSGGGIDVILSAKRVGPTGVAYGLDMTDEMLALARRNAEEAGVTNVHFLKGVIEQIPLPADSVDVVISNCVINLSVDKPAVLMEIARVLKPGGRLGVSDVVAEDRLTVSERAERGSYVGCIAGALSQSEYVLGLESVGLEDVTVELTHEVADGMHGAIVKATKTREPARKGLPVVQPLDRAGCCWEEEPMNQALDPVTRNHVDKAAAALGRVRRRLLEETIARYIGESLDLLGDSSINVFVPVLAHRFARERLKALAQVEGALVKEQPEVLFVCVHNAGRSQMAAGLVGFDRKDASTCALPGARRRARSTPSCWRSWTSSASTWARRSRSR